MAIEYHSTPQYNTSLIRNAIKTAIENAGNGFYYDEATRDQIGSVDIADALFQKIKNSTVVIADITSINKNSVNERKVPNPNVMLELGFAAGILGWSSIVPIFNLAHGNLQDVPFDIRNRRIVTYYAEEGSDITKETKKISSALAKALKQMDFEAVKRRDFINRNYSDQSERAKFYAIQNDDDYWHTKLLCELLIPVSTALKNEYELVTKGITFVDSKRINPEDFVTWLLELHSFQVNIITSLSEITQRYLVEVLNSEDAVAILRLSQTIERIGNKFIEFELKRRSLIVDKRLEEYKMKLGTDMDAFLAFLNKLILVASLIGTDEPNKPKITADDVEPIFNFGNGEIEKIQQLVQKIMLETVTK